MRPAIDVAVTPDRAYVASCAALLHSLLQHNAAQADVTVHFFVDATLEAADVAGVEQVVRAGGGRWQRHEPDLALEQQFAAGLRYPAAAFRRLFFGRLLPGIDKVLYLDADTLVLGDLRPLWSLDVSGHVLAAATHPLFPHFSRERIRALGVRDLSDFFNSGVLLMNLPRLRRHEAAFGAFLADPRRRALLAFADQDVFNAVLPPDSRLTLHPRWNLQVPHLELPLAWLDEPAAPVAEARRMPAIVHFNGTIKPWHYRSRHPYKARFREHLAQTPWRGLPEPDRNLKNALLRWLPGWVVPLARSRLGL